MLHSAAPAWPDLPPVRITHAPLRLPAGVRWCAKCGYEVTTADLERFDKPGDGTERRATAHCPRCHSKRLIPAVDVLQPNEYVLAA